MMVVDELWEQSSKLSDNYSIEFYDNDIALVKNIFKYPELVLRFQKLLSTWESAGSAKPGLMSLKMPSWTVFHIADDLFEWDYKYELFESEYILFYDGNTTKWNDKPDNIVTNECYLPHTDDSECDGCTIIGLVNLNPRIVKTGFWSYMGEMMPDSEMIDDYYEYASSATKENYKYMFLNVCRLMLLPLGGASMITHLYAAPSIARAKIPHDNVVAICT